MPKALVPVAGVPVAARLLAMFARHGIREVGVMAGHLADPLKAGLLPWAKQSDIHLTWFVEDHPLGTAGGLWMAREFVGDQDFLVVYADIVADVDLARLAEFHSETHGAATIVCHPNDHPRDSDLLDVEERGRVRQVLPRKTRAPGDYRNVVPAAIYAASPRLFDFVEREVMQDFVNDVFPRLAGAGELFAYQTPEYLRDMGTEARFAMAERDLASGRVEALRFHRRRPAVFFDRDGTLNEDVGGHGLVRPEDLRLIPGAAEAVRLVNQAGWLAIGVTNQPQLAKGFLTRDGLDRIHARLDTLLGDAGAWLDRLYFCPHHPERGFEGEITDLKIACDCRKPKSGMILRAADELPADLTASCLIGDSFRDVGAARAAGILSYGVRTGVGCRDLGQAGPPDRMFENVQEAVSFLTQGSPVRDLGGAMEAAE